MSDSSKGMTGKALALIGVIFVLGMVCGASLFYVGQRSVASADDPPRPRRPPEGDHRPPRPLEDMTRRLGLDADQQAEIRQILDRYRDETDGMLEDSRLEIRDVLTEQQREQFDTLRPPRPGAAGHPPPHQRRPAPRGQRKGPPPPRRP